MDISKRLEAVAGLVSHEVIADIGTDHGYVPIYLFLKGKIKSPSVALIFKLVAVFMAFHNEPRDIKYTRVNTFQITLVHFPLLKIIFIDLFTCLNNSV